MDPFEVRMQFLALLKRLTASQQSIQKVVGFAVKYFPSCGEDIWECIIEGFEKGSINARINVLYFLDSLCETCLVVKSQQKAHRSGSSEKRNANLYVDFVARDLTKIVDLVVPQGRQGLPNLVSTKQILERWRSKRILDPQKVDEVVLSLNSRTTLELPTTSPPNVRTAPPNVPNVAAPPSPPPLSRNEVLRRIEEDRERHKRLRERRWVQPISYSAPSFNPNSVPLASFLPLSDGPQGGYGDEEAAVDIEFENEWETTSDWNEDDIEVVTEERELCFPREGEGPMDLS
ncbi:CTD kinase subunit gamma CTK3-domain-containing protein [Ephemerocybe angulata]|uniref:CTD kinase subunit gamma CTK3-domain-containing protein n=1 Tax=Ephemerocybe angulata TaxID=980116 RepID=A0A8H6HI75_9AGAR|nr:CTD kinase subunit gamma CTK3-domain-containing protein [Tulosesus angulatus]